jgi:hypothetical protein
MQYNIRHRQVPETRLPFVNAEITQVQFAGEPHLVSSIWGGDSGGRIYFWNPDTGSHHERWLPDGVPGAYMLKTALDGTLYLGCGNGDLITYAPETDTFETLVSGEMTSITWGGCVTERYAVWSASPGHAAVYDIQRRRLVKVFRPLDTDDPTALYGHRVIEAPDGRAILSMNVPQARLVVLDLDTMEPRSYTPGIMKGCSWTADATFLDDETLGIFVGNADEVMGTLALLHYPSFELVGTIAPPDGVTQLGGKACFADGRFCAFAQPENSLYALDLPGRRWDRVAEHWTGDDPAILSAWGESDICGLTPSGIAHRLNLRTGHTDSVDLEANGLMGVHTFCAVPDEHLIIGAPFINQRFWMIDTETGEANDMGRAAPGGGQVNQIVWDPTTRRALLSSYTTASVTAFDPSRSGSWPENPVLVASAHDHGQMRPMALAHDGRHVWMATSPNYGTLGGALCRIDPTDGSIEVWRNLVPDQRFVSIIADPDRRVVYASTDVMADCGSAPPTQTTARIVAFDMDELAVRAELSAPDGVDSAKVCALLPTGEVLVETGGEFLSWNAANGAVRPLGPPPGNTTIANDDRGMLWAAVTGHGIGRLHVLDDSIRFESLIDEDGRHLHIAADKLYYETGYDVCEVELTELRKSIVAEEAE